MVCLTALGSDWCYSTSEIFDKVLQLHLPLWLDVGAVHVCVEEDDGKGQDEYSVWVPELAHHTMVTDAVALAGGRKRGKERKRERDRLREEDYFIRSSNITQISINFL